MEERAWHPGKIYEAWAEIHCALDETMTTLPPQTLAFLAERAADKIIRDKAAQALDSLDNLTGAAEHAIASADELRRQFRQVTSE